MSKQSRDRAARGSLPYPEAKAFLARWSALLAGSLVVLAALAAYHNSFSGPFIYDDLGSSTGNPTIQHLWPVWKVLSPPPTQTVGGRPLVNLSLALNYALSGDAVWSYHAMNLLIHILAGLTLLGLVRRTLLQPVLHGRFDAMALPLALAVALLWVVHPLQTECVTYIIQRAESLMGLFYLLTLYCFVRSTDETGERQEATGNRPDRGSLSNSAFSFQPSPSRRSLREGGTSGLWPLASCLFCFLGMASKEVMVSAPLMVLLYDRTFVAGSFRAAWQQRRKLYLGLTGTWLLLGYLMVATGSHGGTVRFGASIPAWAYALTQFRAIAHYLRLAVWPQPLVFDYGVSVLRQVAVAAPYAAIIVPLVALTVVGLWRNHPLGFLGAWFFAILAPSSSVLPLLTETVAEHRMYLPLATVAVLVVLGLYSLLGRRSAVVFLALVVGLGWVTVQRNKDYQSAMAIWSDTVAKCPDNGRAHDNLGNALVKIPDRIPDAMAQFEEALRLDPDSSKTHNNLGSALLKMPDRIPDAIAQFEAALRLNPDFMEAHYNLGNALLNVPGRSADAIVQFEAALRLNPDSVETHINLGNALLNEPGRSADAITQYEAAVRLDPGSAKAHYDLGNALLNVPGRSSDAMAQFEAALRIDPDSAETHENYGAGLLDMPGRLPDAIAQFEAALRLNPDSVETHINLGIALLKTPGREPEAIAQFQTALRLNPDLPQVREMLARLQDQGASPTDSSSGP
jgi:tetratricopeptide (TPR) repeat protein